MPRSQIILALMAGDTGLRIRSVDREEIKVKRGMLSCRIKVINLKHFGFIAYF